MGTHTAGPWGIPHFKPQEVCVIGGLPIAIVECGRKEWKANAALISAAPDLLQMCERALALLANPDADQFMADAMEVELQMVINKARGQ